ncbi:hypothetical protein [Paenibacillus sp. TY11]|uniref:hypothetical protein n=1 Tax=Paenibacillus sp. TY11 TaxID=3448633 RepID=UPI00403A4314
MMEKKKNNGNNIKTLSICMFHVIKKTLIAKLCIVSILLFLIGLLFAYIGDTKFSAFAGTLLCISFLGLYYGIISWTLNICGFFDFWRKIRKKDMLLSFLVFFIVAVFVFAEVSRDRFVYFWDYGGYWGVTIEQSRNFFIIPFQTLRDLYVSINIMEYNNIIPSLLALPMKIVGESFVSYVMLVLFLFIFPMSLVLSFCFYKITKKAGWNKISEHTTLLILFSFPFLFMPLFFGYLDATCLLATSVLWLVAIDYDWGKMDYRKCIVMSLMLILVVLQRRYFAFFAVSYILALSASIVLKFLFEKEQRKNLIKYFILNMAFVGTLSLGILLLLFRGFLEQSVFNDFSRAYSAYSNGNNLDKFGDVTKSFGLYLYSFVILGFLIGIMKKGIRSISLSLFLSFIITQILFFRIQSMGPHHKYLLYTQISLLVLVAIAGIYNFLIHDTVKRIGVTVLAVLFLLNFAYTFRLIPLSKVGGIIYSVESYQPKVRADIPQLQLLANNLNTMSQQHNSKIYVLASSTYINDDILRKLYLPDVVNYMPNLASSSNVDLRDGFPVEFLNADIVVVADPIQYHLRAEDQQVVGLLAKEIMQGHIINNNFTFSKEYTIENGIKLRVYKKSSSFTQKQIQYLRGEFDKIYPNFPELFKNRIKQS